ncbi:MAG: phosphoribosylglycinamide formyltransferase [Candidatus Muproteobacteria bacterium RBG_16_64_11]|uniref:Phosphoribosylglycinamide formyltransferase n=1 Tax=Candidatus Muproteobacteria bacterium RBG_16_64_11 TaxID=1817758 RepID=A0A1F6TE26_9PROT|nr:MAG: phosphoribosylglycinamide formyltransferase [Candidatus Muproteobacteria bacterium RBG_16_64_11]
MNSAPAPVVILISGRGSNLQAIVEASRTGRLPIAIRAVISNNPTAPGLEIARAAGLVTQAVDHRAFTDRAAFDRALMEAIDRHAPRLVVLAGFLRILGKPFIDHYTGRLMNIHPSLLPAFKGLDTHARALAAGVKRHGASVHFVGNDVDGGPVIIQAEVPVVPGDDAETLAARVLAEEHRILPLAIRWFVENRLSVRDGRVLLDGQVRPEQHLVAAPPTGTH